MGLEPFGDRALAGPGPSLTTDPGCSLLNATGIEGRLCRLTLAVLADGAGKALAHSCIVPGVTSTYRRIPDSADGCTLGLPEGEGEEPRQLLLPKLASWDSGVEMVAGDSPVATFPGLSQDSLSVEPTGSCEPSALAAPEPPGQLGRLLASRKLEQVLERSQARPRLSAQCHALPSAPWSRPGCEIPLLGAGQEPTKAKAEPEVDLEEAEGVTVVPRAWACLPGQGLRYLEHLCLVLEQMARLQQLYLQLQTQRPPEDPEEEEPALVPLPSLSPAPGNGIKGSEELLSPTKETGTEAAGSKVGMLGVNPPRLPEAPAEPNDSFSPSQGHKDPSHWDKLKVMLNRIRWRSPGHLEPSVPPSGCDPRTESRDLSESPQCHHHQKTFMPSLVVKKQRAKDLSVC
ncbi:uncharacterized protein C8orf58 homolog isoform X1 [Cavia porcellus]|uniref:Chromosome 8 open reading frame 58 n=1 Tax=Cavia porcellus TaxID=10141 RepID=A0A286XLM0_CAVPO|nr:uncharacterized protein C8orf58 homolog isoform X1 [Cavia porcellus]